MINLRQNNGFALVFSLIFLFLIVCFVAVFILVVGDGFINANRTANGIKAYYVAEAGLADAYERILQTTPAATNNFIPSPGTDNGIYSLGGNDQGSYTVSLAATYKPITYTITSTGTYGGVQRTLKLQIQGAAISQYAYWAQVEGWASWWITGQTVDGPAHTNGSYEIWGNPLFDGPTSQSGSSVDYWGGTGSVQSQIFTDGLQLNSSPIALPSQSTLTAIQTAASNGGLILTGTSQVVFSGTSGTPTFTVTGNVVNSNCVVTQTFNNTTLTPSSPGYPANGVIYVQSTSTIPACNSGAQDGNVTVQGTVSGQATVAADQNINISGNILYNDEPVRPWLPGGDPNSTDMLGLVASQNITVLSAYAPAQLELDGVLVAINGSVQADNAWVQGMGNLYQFGSLVNYTLGVLGYFDPSNGQIDGGWNQLQFYDPRLETMTPPGFPLLYNSQGLPVYTKLSFTEL